MGRSADLPIFHQFWRHVRQNCIFREETLAFLEKNEFMQVREFVCAVREFPRFPFSLKNQGFSTNYAAARPRGGNYNITSLIYFKSMNMYDVPFTIE